MRKADDPALDDDPSVEPEVSIVRADLGGWDVMATVAGQLIATRHCDDWHRAERTRTRMRADPELSRQRGARVQTAAR